MKIKIKETLQTFALTVFIGFPVCWGIGQYELSKEIKDPTVQEFYSILAQPENTLELPTPVHSALASMMSDGFSSTDYYDLNEVIRVECGEKPQSLIDKHLTRTVLGMLQLMSMNVISVHSSMVATDGKVIVNQLDSTMCEYTE